MNSKKILLSIMTLALWTIGCQKMTTGADGILDSTSNGLATSCKTATAPINPSLLQIEGAPVAQKGASVTYQLNTDLSCSPTQKVSWRTIGDSNSQSVKTGTAIKSSFQKTGEYVVVAQIEKNTLASSSISLKTVVVSDQPVISGPALAMVGTPVSYSLAIPTGLTIESATWNFGDSSILENNINTINHTFSRPGTYQISATVVDSNRTQITLVRQVNVLMIQDGLECVSDLTISGASEAIVDTPVSLSLYIPSCLTSKISAVQWGFGDGATSGGQSVQHTYQTAADYQISVQIFVGASTTPWVTLTHDLSVGLPLPEPSPSPSPEPTPTNPKACSIYGEKRSSQSEIYSEAVACGIDGTKNMSYRDTTVEECKLVGEGLEWVEISKSKELKNEGLCQDQSCKLSDGSIITNGTSKANIITGEASVALTCAYGEQGYFSIFNQVSDQECKNGQIITSNTHQGDIKTLGLCPTYSNVPTENWTTCSADCGGKQSRIYHCKDNKGAEAPAERCAVNFQTEERACDGNPAAVRRQEQSVVQEEANSSEKCPSNQIGVISSTRDKITTTTFVCTDHSVQQEKQEVAYGAWATEKYCRDYVAHRCSHDSLSNSEALGRFKWMAKCQDQIPVVKEFLGKFIDIGVKIGGGNVEIDNTRGRLLYPTFLNRETKPEKAWIAPKSASADCTVPSTVYIAAVCVSSCATPEQQILADENIKGSSKYVTFIEALTKKYSYVATLKTNSSLNSRSIEKTAVDQWVTELLDGDHDIIVFKMKSGRQLKLTPNHPLLASDGLMKQASDFHVGDALVVLGGEFDPIISLNHINHYGKVYNLFVKSSEIKKNIVVTNGYLNGTAFFQNQGADNLNRRLFKNKMTQGVFSK